MINETDEYILSLMSGDNEDAIEALYKKYSPQISYLVKKYYNIAQKNGMEYNDLLQEANIAFTYALNSYNNEKGTTLKTYIYLCVERRLRRIAVDQLKGSEKINFESLSLDYEYGTEDEYTLKDVLGDDSSDPLINYTENEKIENIIEKIKEALSPFELDVFTYMLMDFNYQEISKILDKTPKQIDNTMQRIRLKAKEVLKKERNE